MAATIAALDPPKAEPRVPRLENGDQLSGSEFMRRYEAMPQLKKAELIEGIVYMGSPVSLDHAEPDSLVQGWLLAYSANTPGSRTANNATVRLGPRNVPQPDALLRLLPEAGGQTREDDGGYLCGPPELVVEIATSSVALDLHGKPRMYCIAGVREYLVWRTLDGEFDWFVLDGKEYRRNLPDSEGLLRSSHFRGLVLDVQALLAHDAARVLQVLHANLAGR